MKSTDLLQLVGNLQQAGTIHKFHNLQQVCGISGCVCYAHAHYLVNRGRRRSIIGGAHIHILVFTDCKNNRFQKKLMMHNMNICICAPPLIDLLRPLFVNQLTITIIVIDKSQKAYHTTVKKFHRCI